MTGEKKLEYASSNYMERRSSSFPDYNIRLFRLSYVVGGNPSAEEIIPFAQSDLEDDSVFLLDCYFELYVWVGSDARSNYKNVKLALETAVVIEYYFFIELDL